MAKATGVRAKADAKRRDVIHEVAYLIRKKMENSILFPLGSVRFCFRLNILETAIDK